LVAKMMAIPRRLNRAGIERFGFHGLSYSFLMEKLKKIGGSREANSRVILAHLGNGASLAAVRNGKSMDTTMGFTPTAGIPMSTRSGDIDPGIVSYLVREEKMTIPEFKQMTNSKSGLLGVSETSSDMRDLLRRRKKDHRAQEAIDLFCYQIKKTIGAYAAVLGGLDTIVFSGGIGENSSEVRSQICDGLEHIGIKLNERQNGKGVGLISSSASKVRVRVIPTDEEIQIVHMVTRVLGNSSFPRKRESRF